MLEEEEGLQKVKDHVQKCCFKVSFLFYFSGKNLDSEAEAGRKEELDEQERLRKRENSEVLRCESLPLQRAGGEQEPFEETQRLSGPLKLKRLFALINNLIHSHFLSFFFFFFQVLGPYLQLCRNQLF